MFAFPILLASAGYTVLSYGYLMIKGYDITLKEWVSPLHPYKWPSGPVPTVPQGQIFPSSKG